MPSLLDAMMGNLSEQAAIGLSKYAVDWVNAIEVTGAAGQGTTNAPRQIDPGGRGRQDTLLSR